MSAVEMDTAVAERTNDPSSVTFTPLTETMGQEVRGIDLSKAVPAESIALIREALANNSILLFRDQTAMTPEEHIAFSREFGALEEHIVTDFLLPGYPEIFVVSNIVENGRNIGAHGGAKHWHSDLSYKAEPSLGSIFHCLECPSEGGETEFAGMYAPWEALPEERKQWLRDHNAVHDYVWHYRTYLSHRKPLTDEQKAKLPPVTHPSVRTHPDSGREALYVAHGLVHHFEGVSFEESQELLEELTAFATQPQFTYRHKWRPGDVVFWDNRNTMHRACPYDDKTERRRMQRTTIKGDRPYLAA